MADYHFGSDDHLEEFDGQVPEPGAEERRQPTLRELQVAARVAEEKTLREAAVRLGISTPGVSRVVKSLHNKLAVEVFRLSPGRGVSMTDAGRQLIEPIKQAAAAAQDLQDLAARARAGKAFEIRVACYPVHVQWFLAEALARFRNDEVSVSLVGLSDAAPADGGVEIMARLVRGQADLAIARASSSHPDVFVETPLYSWRLQVGVADMYAFGTRFGDAWAYGRGVGLPVAALEGVPLLLAPSGFLSREAIRDACLRSGFEPSIYASTANTPSLFALAKAGLGATVLPSDAYPEDLFRQDLSGPGGEPIGGSFSAYRKKSEHPSSGDTLDPIDSLIELIGEIARQAGLRL